jgi:hypothetical protein
MTCRIDGRELSRTWINHFAPGAQNSSDALLAHCLIHVYRGMHVHAVTLWHGADEHARDSWPWLQARY